MPASDFQIIKEPAPPLRRAFDTLSRLHDVADRIPRVTAGASRKSCVFSARTSVRFLQQIGFDGAKAVACVLFVVEYNSAKQPIGTEKIGDFKNSGTIGSNGLWLGHMVVLVDGYLFDPTAGQIKMENVPFMIANPEFRALFKGQPTLSGLGMTRNKRYIELYWIEAPGSSCEEYAGVQRQMSETVATALLRQYQIDQRSRTSVNTSDVSDVVSARLHAHRPERL